MTKREIQKTLRHIKELMYRMNGAGWSSDVSKEVEALSHAIRMVGEHREKPKKAYEIVEYGPHGDKLW